MTTTNFISWLGLALSKGLILIAGWFLLAVVLRGAKAAWLRAWWRVGFVAMCLGGVLALFPARWHLAPARPATQAAPRVLPAETVDQTARTKTLPATATAGRGFVSPVHWWVAVWAVGFGSLMLRMIAARTGVRRLLRSATCVTDPVILAEAAAECCLLGVARAVPVLTLSATKVPFVTGCWRPRIVLPLECTQWSAVPRRAVLRHELAHVAAGDLFWQGFAELVAALNWPNPLIWIARRQLLLVQERAADDTVLGAGMSPVEYAELLAGIARRETSLSCHAAVTSMARTSTLRLRVARLLDPAQSRGMISVTGRTLTAVFGVIAALVTGLTGLRAQEQPPAAPSLVNWSRNYRDTLLLEKSFAEHFTGSSTEALVALKKELTAAGVVLPKEVTLELRADKNALVVDYPETLLNEKAWGLTDYMTKQGWWNRTNEVALRAKQAAVERSLQPLRAEIERQRDMIVAAAAEMAKLRERNKIIDPDPENASALISATDRDIVALETQMNEARLQVTKTEAQFEQIVRMKPEELVAALRVLRIEDQTIQKVTGALQDVVAKETELLANGMQQGHPKVKAVRAQKEAFLKTLSSASESVRQNQASLLEIERRRLKELESRWQAAREKQIADKESASTYIEAKARYLQARRIYEAAELRYNNELLERFIDR
jgi:beta-lactamase regulating signal transducer with metallopeptidase domain